MTTQTSDAERWLKELGCGKVPTLQGALLALVEKTELQGLSGLKLGTDVDPLEDWLVSQLTALGLIIDILHSQRNGAFS